MRHACHFTKFAPAIILGLAAWLGLGCGQSTEEPPQAAPTASAVTEEEAEPAATPAADATDAPLATPEEAAPVDEAAAPADEAAATPETAPDAVATTATAAVETSPTLATQIDVAPAVSSAEEGAAAVEEGGNPVVVIKTSLGEIEVELYPDKAPISVGNFLTYVNDAHYSGTIFHRVIPGFMIQGGGFTEDMREKETREPIKNEADNGLQNLRGTIAMARTDVVDSATSQFFINVNDENVTFLDHQKRVRPDGSLDYGYAVFGMVVQGMDVVDRIAAAPTTTRNRMSDVPVSPIIIESVTVKP